MILYLHYVHLTYLTMEKIRKLLRSKSFWTLISAILAALSAFFLSSCSAQGKMSRSGVHIDTVRVDYIVRSNNFIQP